MIDELDNAVAFFSDLGNCHYVGAMSRWRRGVVCPGCGSRRTTLVAASLPHVCKACGERFDWRTGTIYEGSRIPLTQWMVATWAIAFYPAEITPAILAAAILVSPAVAGRMLSEIRSALRRGERRQRAAKRRRAA